MFEFVSAQKIESKHKAVKSVVFGDLHIPFQDKRAVSLLLKFIKLYQPDNIFINGDLLDCWAISKFTKPVNLEVHLSDEIAETKSFLRTLRKTAPKSKIFYIFGNHSWRFEKYLADEAGMFKNLQGMSLEEQLGCAELKIQVINKHLKENHYRFGHILIGHFNKVCANAGYTAHNLLLAKGMSLIQGHTHRGAMVYKRTYRDTMVGVEGFCLCDINPTYMSLPNWQLGFCTISSDDTGFFKINLRPIIEYQGAYQVKFGEQVLVVRR